MLKEFFSVSLLIIGFIFTFFLSGSGLVEILFPRLPKRIKFPLYFILSLIVSTYTVYLISLVAGFSRYSIIVSFLSFIPLFIYTWKHIVKTTAFFVKNHPLGLAGGIFVFVLFLFALYPAIFTWHDGYIVMSSSNWQDTAMHMGIVESISQGNFPPQAPYYAGVPLTYYYFTDFHSAILSTLYGSFFPRILVYDNPFFVFMFFLEIYCLSYELIRKKTAAFLSALTGSLFSSYMFVRFIQDVLNGANGLYLIEHVARLLADHSYSMEYEQLFQVSNMADYFLQNRPMMVGLPAVVAIVTLIYYAFSKKDIKVVFLAGALVGLLVRFQFFSVVASIIAFGFIYLFSMKKLGMRLSFKFLLLFLMPALGCFLLLANHYINNQSLILLVKENFKFGPWEEGRDILWHLRFVVSNFGVPLVITVFTLLYLAVAFIRRKKFPHRLPQVSFLALTFFLIPYCLRFTVYKGDMFKFFYFMVVFLVIATFWFLGKVVNNRRTLILISVLIMVTSTASSYLTLVNSALNKNRAYSQAEYKAGIWIRENTPQKSVFVTNPTVHCAVTQIGGRLRVLSYINWPHSHGYNTGEDNVFARLGEVKEVYLSHNTQAVKTVLAKYNAKYVYLSEDEKSDFPEAESFFNKASFLKKIYSEEGINIYEVI